MCYFLFTLTQAKVNNTISTSICQPIQVINKDCAGEDKVVKNITRKNSEHNEDRNVKMLNLNYDKSFDIVKNHFVKSKRHLRLNL